MVLSIIRQFFVKIFSFKVKKLSNFDFLGNLDKNF